MGYKTYTASMSTRCCNCVYKEWQMLYRDMEKISTELRAHRHSIWAVKNEEMPNGRPRYISFDSVKDYKHWVETDAIPTLRQLYDSVQLEARRCKINIPTMKHLQVCDLVLCNGLEQLINELCEMVVSLLPQLTLKSMLESFKTWDLQIKIDDVREQIRICLREMGEHMYSMRLNCLRHEKDHCQKCREQPNIVKQNEYLIT